MASSTFQLELIRFDGGAARTAATLVGVSQVCVCVCVCVCACVRRLMKAKKKSKRRTKRKIGCCWRARPGPPISSHLLRSLLRLPVSLERNDFFSSDFTVDSSLEASDGWLVWLIIDSRLVGWSASDCLGWIRTCSFLDWALISGLTELKGRNGIRASSCNV